MENTLRLGDPLPRPQIESCLELDADSHKVFWCQVLHDFDWWGIRLQSRILYFNNSSVPRKGCTP